MNMSERIKNSVKLQNEKNNGGYCVPKEIAKDIIEQTDNICKNIEQKIRNWIEVDIVKMSDESKEIFFNSEFGKRIASVFGDPRKKTEKK